LLLTLARPSLTREKSRQYALKVISSGAVVKQKVDWVFFRVNRQYIIHIDAVQQLHNYFNGKLKVDIRNNPQVEIVVSRDKSGALRTWTATITVITKN
jgi:hypothetical protein